MPNLSMNQRSTILSDGEQDRTCARPRPPFFGGWPSRPPAGGISVPYRRSKKFPLVSKTSGRFSLSKQSGPRCFQGDAQIRAFGRRSRFGRVIMQYQGKPMILSAALMHGLGIHLGAWMAREGDAADYVSGSFYRGLARTAEAGKLHALFLAEQITNQENGVDRPCGTLDTAVT